MSGGWLIDRSVGCVRVCLLFFLVACSVVCLVDWLLFDWLVPQPVDVALRHMMAVGARYLGLGRGGGGLGFRV